jgi:integrase/recombinase XerD
MTKGTRQEEELEDGEKYAPTKEEVRQMEENVGNQHRTRDQLIVRMLWQTLARPGELAQLEVNDVDRQAREVHIRNSIAKNGNGRVVAYQSTLDGLLSRYLDIIRPDRLGPKENNRLFVGERGGSLDHNTVSEIVVDAACRADLNRILYQDANGGERWLITGHNIRHGAATYLAHETEMDIYKLSKALGHSNVETTENIYVEENERGSTEAMHEYGPD